MIDPTKLREQLQSVIEEHQLNEREADALVERVRRFLRVDAGIPD